MHRTTPLVEPWVKVLIIYTCALVWVEENAVLSSLGHTDRAEHSGSVQS